MIYFVQQDENGPIKIGHSSDPSSRLRQLQTGNPQKLFYRGDLPGGLEKEREIHTKFQEYRIRPDQEWFYPAEEILRFIKENCRTGGITLIREEPNGEIEILLAEEIELSLADSKWLVTRFGNFDTRLLLRFEQDKSSRNGEVTERVFLEGFAGDRQVLLMQLSELGLDQKILEEIKLLLMV